jgi:hypothetical protein
LYAEQNNNEDVFLAILQIPGTINDTDGAPFQIILGTIAEIDTFMQVKTGYRLFRATDKADA